MKKTAVILLLVLTASCTQTTTPKQPTRYYAEFFVRYLAAEKQYKAEATFARGDSLAGAVPVELGNTVSFAGRPLRLRQLSEGLFRYDLTFDDVYQSTTTFSFQLPDQAPGEHQVNLTPILDFSVSGPATIDGGFTLETTGGELQADESLVVLISDQNNKAHTVLFAGPRQSGAYRIPGAELQSLARGRGSVYLVKKKDYTEQKGRQVVHTELEYYTGVAELEIQ